MSMEIKGDAPLTPEERRYLQDRGQHDRIAAIDAQYPPADESDKDGVPGPEWSPATGLESVPTAALLEELDRRHSAGEDVWNSGEVAVTAPLDDAYDSMTVQEMQQELARRGLPTNGKKAELIERLRDSDREAVNPL